MSQPVIALAGAAGDLGTRRQSACRAGCSGGAAVRVLAREDGRSKLEPLDNERYPKVRWASAREHLAADPPT